MIVKIIISFTTMAIIWMLIAPLLTTAHDVTLKIDGPFTTMQKSVNQSWSTFTTLVGIVGAFGLARYIIKIGANSSD